MLRIGSMNMLLHGVENPDIRYRDSLAQEHAGRRKNTSILGNPPFAGSLDVESCATNLLQVLGIQRKTRPKRNRKHCKAETRRRTKKPQRLKTESLFLALFLRLLKPGGRAAVIVPDGVAIRVVQTRTKRCARCS